MKSRAGGSLSCKRTIKAMRACVLGVPIVSTGWVEKCIGKKRLVLPGEDGEEFVRTLMMKRDEEGEEEGEEQPAPSKTMKKTKKNSAMKMKRGGGGTRRRTSRASISEGRRAWRSWTGRTASQEQPRC